MVDYTIARQDINLFYVSKASSVLCGYLLDYEYNGTVFSATRFPEGSARMEKIIQLEHEREKEVLHLKV